MLGMDVLLAPRPLRRQAMLVCLLGAYLALLAAGSLALISLVAPTGALALAMAVVGPFGLLAAAVLWASDRRAARRRPLAAVTPLGRPATLAAARRTVAR
jgi:hypothetical protein